MKKILLYTIAYSQLTLDQVEDGYLVLENLTNERPDWREYWPIRNFLVGNELDEESYYGFFSPRFREKTGLSFCDVREFISSASDEVEVFTFSPQVDIGAFFPNVFVGGEAADPGFLDTCQKFVDRIGLPFRLDEMVSNSGSTVFSNFLVAKPSFWCEWFEICEKLFSIAESVDGRDELRDGLVWNTPYREGVQRKVFVVEGVASLLLTARSRKGRVFPYNPFSLAWSSQLGLFKQEAIVCDALKIAINERGYREYKDTYESIRQRVLKLALGTRKECTMKQTPAHDKYNDTIFQMLPKNLKRVVEVGCMWGSLAKIYLAENPDCHWIGVDIDPDNVDVAKAVCHEAVCCDIETLSDDDFEQWRGVDAWVFGDVLEHLRDPWALLARIRRVIPPNGVILASIPNAQNWSFQARVNAGQFRYENDGLFDRTHLRFFTRVTIFEMFQGAGFRIDNAVSRVLSSPDADKYLPHIRSMAVASGLDPDVAEQDAMAFQYVVKAVAV